MAPANPDRNEALTGPTRVSVHPRHKENPEWP